VKILQLHINNFGHFSEQDIRLSNDGPQVIYGPNEAGKTTLLEFLRGWLFDFPARTPYDFKGGTEVAGVGTLELGDGRKVELRRRKGNKNKVALKIDGRDTDLDEVGLQRLLGNANRNLFESIFAFGLDQLALGEESLTHESLQSALYGGGLGLATSPESILKTLEKEADELFSPSRSKPAVNMLLGELNRLAKEVKEKSLKPVDFQQRLTAVEVSETRAKQLHEQVNELRREHSRLDRMTRAWPKWHELQLRANERSPLRVPTAVPVDARQLFNSTTTRLQETKEDITRLEAAIAEFERELGALHLQPQTVSRQSEIQDCLELRKSYLEARDQLPERMRQRAATKQQIERELGELRPGWTLDDLRAFSIDIATHTEIERLVTVEQAIKDERTSLEAKQESIEGRLRDAHADIKSLGEPRVVSSLAAVLADETAYVSDKRQQVDRASEVDKLDRQLTTRRRKLLPLLAATGGSPHELPVPRVETIAQFEAEFADLRQQLRAANDALKEHEKQRRQLTEKEAETSAGAGAPSLQDRDVARQRRDVGWQLIRGRHVEGQPAPADEQKWLADTTESLVNAYELSIRDADQVADRIYENADAVARREEVRRQFVAVDGRIAQTKAELEELIARDNDLQNRWKTLWQPCGFEPLAPEAMRHWLADHQIFCETMAARAECAADLTRLADRWGHFEDRLRLACGSTDTEVAVLLTMARQAVEEAKNYQRDTKKLRSTINQLEPQRDECARQLAALDERQTSWGVEWRALLSRLHLPTDWPTELARRVIAGSLATRVKLDGLPGEEERIQAMQARILEFESMVLPLCEALAPSLVQDPRDLAVTKLSKQLEGAAAAQTKFEQLQGRLAASRAERQRIEDRRAEATAERRSLFVAAGVEAELEFLEVVSRAERIRELDGVVERLNREIDLIRAGDNREAFEQSLGQAEPGVLEGRHRDVAVQLQDLEQEVRNADGAAAVAKKELASLDGSGETALLTDQQSRMRARLAAEVDRYVPLALAKHLLSDAIRRFERANQPEMIATVSQLFSQMTAGRYTEFDRAGGDRKGILVRLKDGRELTPERLSTGTRQQLYLAIRLAYVLHYCRQNEPLPIIMDDVLVNFDADRTRQTLSALASVSSQVQVLFFTCHAHMVTLAKEVFPGLIPIHLPGV